MTDYTTEQSTNEIPYGFCHCGCGQKTKIAMQNHKQYGWKKGQPMLFVVGHRSKHPLTRERFLERVDKQGDGGCWLWLGCKDKKGYGIIQRNRKAERAPRIAWELYIGTIPDKLFVCHKCDNPSCVNPDHLFVGTLQDNTADMVAKQRQIQGETVGSSKLTTIQVIEIRQRYRDGVSQRALSKEYGITKSGIQHVVRRQTWRHIP